MSKTATTSSAFNPMRATGAELRDLAAKGFAPAQAEIARRASKPAKTVAAAVSRGADLASVLASRATAKAAPAPKPSFAYAKTEVISPAVERKLRTKGVMSAMLEGLKEDANALGKAPAPAPKRDTIAAVRADLGGRLDRLEAQQSQVLEKLDGLATLVSLQAHMAGKRKAAKAN